MEKCHRIRLSKDLIGLTPGTQNVSFPNQASRGKCLTLEISHPTGTAGRMQGPHQKRKMQTGSRGGLLRQASLLVLRESRCLAEEQSELALARALSCLASGQGPALQRSQRRLPKLEFTGKGKEMLGNFRDLPSSDFLSERVKTKRKENISKKKITMQSDRNYDRG